MRQVAVTAGVLAAFALGLLSPPAASAATAGGPPSPGAPGIGDPYFPLDGNGGYDVRHYGLDLTYDPATDVLDGVAKIRARATQTLSSFNLDFQGLEIRALRVNGRAAAWSRDAGELQVTPRHPLRKGRTFTVLVAYDGVPETLEGPSGFIHTDDGALVAGQPESAVTWFPSNDHPLDTASFSFRITVPKGLEAVANGVLVERRKRRSSTTWVWRAKEPMAPYLATMHVGEFALRHYRDDGIRFWDAVDPDLFTPFTPRTGERFAISQFGDPSYKRLARTIAVPEDGAQLSFWVQRDIEPGWDFMFVEARPAGTEDWTTLPDLNGHTSPETGLVCPYWLGLHPFLTHYQTAQPDTTCAPTGTTGQWFAATGASDGYEQWTVDLSAYAGGEVEVAIAYVSDDVINQSGVFVDDVVVTGAEGSTSFEEDGDVMDGWAATGAPGGSAPNPNDWMVGTAEDAPPPVGEAVEGSLDRQPEIIDFLEGYFGPYPFSAAGGIVDDVVELGFALETQTRPVYTVGFFTDRTSPQQGPAVVVHELAHQWFGDALPLAAWQHIWLNEGFATYAEWLWSEREGLGTVQEIFDSLAAIPADDPFWALTIGDPGPEDLFALPVYLRGAMTLQALRLAVGDEDFFRILRGWATTRAGENVTTDEFVAFAERVAGEELDELFATWLFTPSKPEGIAPEAPGTSAQAETSQRAAVTAGLAARARAPQR